MNNAPRFSNLRNLFTIRSFLILSITLVISFSVRWYIVNYFNYDLYTFKDFFFIGILVSFVRPLVVDVFDMYYPKFEVSLHEVRELPDQSRLTYDKHNERSRRQDPTQTPFQGSQPYTVQPTLINGEEEKGFKFKAKRRFLWLIWKQHSDEFGSFKEFKNSCNGNIRIRSEVKKDLEKELPNLFRRTRKIRWFFNHINRKR